jgi:8-oxo-dGTP pyrophosphatase MutT (NUDIX family)
MIREFSAGGLVYNNKNKVLVIQNSRNFKWGFPKGQLDNEESSEEAALREVSEEGGVKAEIIEKIGKSEFFYVRDGEKVFKTVTYFLMRYISGDPKDHDFEVSVAKWCEKDEALSLLTFKSDKEFLQQAFEKVK